MTALVRVVLASSLGLLSLGGLAGGAAQAGGVQNASFVRLPSSASSSVTVYGADWCGACKVLERGLQEKDIPFEVIDVDRNPEAYARARSASNASVIPITNVVRGSDGTWVIGANVSAVERAYRGE